MASDWQEVALGEIFNVKHGFAFKSEWFTDEPQPTILVTPGNFSIGGGFQNIKPKYYKGPIPKDYVLKPGQIIVTMTDLSKQADTLGYSAIVPDDGNIWLHNQRIGLLEFNESFSSDPIFINYLLRTYNYRSWIIGSASGTTVKHTSPSRIHSFKCKIPPLPEQRAIAHILGSLDDKIELNRQMNQTLEEIGQTIFRHWFVHFEFPNEDGQPYKSSGGEMVDSELGEIPVGWHLRPLDEIANYLNGLALQKYPPENDDYLPVIKIRELNQGITAQTDKASYINIPKEYVIDDGDILFSWSGSLKVVIWGEGKGALNQHLFKVTSEEYPKWFYYYQTLKFLPNFRQIAADKATTMGHIKRSHLKESIVAVPPDNILKQADKILKPIIEQIINNKINSRYLSNIRDSILPKLMSGKIRVNVPEEGTVK